MPDCRIVFNEHSGRYRIERRRWWGWAFVMDQSGEDYLNFDTFQDALHFACRQLPRKPARHRRWKVIDICRQLCPAC